MTTLTLPTHPSFSAGAASKSHDTSLEKLKAPGQEPAGGSPSLVNITFTAIADTAGRMADVFDTAVTLPKLIGDSVGSLNIPGVSWAAATVGSIFAGSLSVFAHGLSLGTGKWLQGIRRWAGVHNGISDTLGDANEVASITAQSFLSNVKDPSVRNDLKEYFSHHSSLQAINLDSSITDKERTSKQDDHKRRLVQLELKLARRAELDEFKALVNADDDPSPVAHKKLEDLAESMASKLIARVEGSHKERLGILGSTMEGSWLALAAKGESGREELRVRIKERLITAYEAEQRGESGRTAMSEARQSLMEAFGAKSAFREAGFYLVLGTLIHTGALSGFISLVSDNSDKIGGALWAGGSYLWDNFAPEAVKQVVNQGLLYAKLAFGGVAGIYAYKGASFVYGIGKGAYDMFGPHTAAHSSPNSMTTHTDTTHIDTTSSPSDIRVADPTHVDTTTHLDASAPRIDPLQSHLDTLRTDALAAPTTTTHSPDVSSALRANVEAISPGSVHVDASTLRTNAELKIVPDSIHADGVRVRPEIHVK
jgi:hypothetical protein